MATNTGGTLLAGRYRVVRRLGSGGMATVFLAEDERLGRRVAVKRLHAESPEDVARRFDREAKLGASLNHPNLVSIFDTVADPEGVLIVMEHVDGHNLADELSGGAPDVARALEILRGVGAALDHAHGNGVVHRDIKPANVLLGPRGVVKLADLGIATATEGTQITRTGTVLGTPSYMAPEQLEGRETGPAVDIYALAALGFECLSGHRARPGRTPLEIAHRVVTEPPPDLTSAWPDAPPPAARALQRGMARDPTQRSRSAGELVEDLSRAVGGGARHVGGIGPSPAAPTRAPAPSQAGAPAGTATDQAGSPAAGESTASAPTSEPTPVPELASEPEPASEPAPAFTPEPAPPPQPPVRTPRPSRQTPEPSAPAPQPSPPAPEPPARTPQSSPQTPESSAPAPQASRPPPEPRAPTPQPPTPAPEPPAPARVRAPAPSLSGRAQTDESAHGPGGAPDRPAGGGTGRRRAVAAALTILAVGAVAMAFALSSGTEREPSSAPPSPSPSGGQAPPTAAAPAPEQTVRDFYTRAANDDFAGAWALLGPGARRQLGGFDSFRGTLASLQSIEFPLLTTTSRTSSRATVELRTVATHRARVDRCSGTTGLSAVPGGWLIDRLGVDCRSGRTRASALPGAGNART